jgi:hypothetical protein
MTHRNRYSPKRSHGPIGKASDLGALVTTAERAEYIRTVLWPEAETVGRPGILCTALHRTESRERSKNDTGDAVAAPYEGEIELEEPSIDSLAAD